MSLAPIEPGIVTKAQRGDAAARDRLFEEAYGRIFRYQLRLLDGRTEEAHELAQETMFRVIRSLPDLREPDRFVPWALRIAANVWRDQGRRKPIAPLEAYAPPAPIPGDDEPAARLHHALERLPEPYRSAVTLRYLEGLDFEAMTEMLGIPSATLRSQVARGLKLLRKGWLP